MARDEPVTIQKAQQGTGFKIPPPKDPAERKAWEEGVARRKAEGRGTFVGDADMAGDKDKKDEAPGSEAPDYAGALETSKRAAGDFRTAQLEFRSGKISPEMFVNHKKVYDKSMTDFDVAFASAQARGDSEAPRLNPMKVSRVADAVGNLAERFDSICARRDSISYRSSGHDLASYGEKAKQSGKSLSEVKSACSSVGLDKEQTDIVLGAYREASK